MQYCPRENGKDTTTTTTADPYQTPSPVAVTRGGDLSDPREARRYRVAKELLDTEKKYCRTLWTIQDTFAEPLKKANILSRKDISTLFPEEVYQLYDKHSILQHQLRERLGSWKWQPLVGDVVARFTDPRQSDVLRLYTSYVNDFPEVLKTFRKMCHTSQPFTRFIKGCLEQPACGGLDLGAFLLTPVQRIPKYILLIKQLLRYTESTHLDYLHLHTCLDRLRDFLARLNDSMEHSFQLVHIHLAPPPSSQVEEEGKVVHLRHLSQFEEGEVKGGGVSSPSVPGYHHHHHHNLYNGNRIGRLPRRSTSSLGSPTTSPTLSPPGSLGSGSPTRPPQRSLSSAGVEVGGGRRHREHREPQQHRQPPLDSRSSSLPRGSPTFGGVAGNVAPPCPTQPRVRSRSESVASRRPLQPHSSPDSTADSPILAPALSVLSVTSKEARWKDMSGSEPFLADTPTSAPSLLTPAPAHSTLSVDGQPHTPPHPHAWTDGHQHTDESRKKKSSLRTSLRNMFTFKKRPRSQT
ncbi:uncharacterized protein LOC135095787 [Scylla paramamosain]|uniref:uncharacterized protein LOC135095787 n=1 Tax=Scylla paramamosain TaxID=85552 RepID=UPI00308319C6